MKVKEDEKKPLEMGTKNGTGKMRTSEDDSKNLEEDGKTGEKMEAGPLKGTVHMKRQIGLVGGISMVMGSVIGCGIFISPAGLLKNADSVATSLIIWAACGIISILMALSYVELGIVVPRSGGEHAYFMEAYTPLHPFWGEIPAFLYAWMNIVFLGPASIAILTLSFGKYTIEPIMKTLDIAEEWKNSDDYDLAVRFLAVAMTCVVTYINVRSAEMATRVTVVFTFTKMVAMGIIIGIGVYNVSKGHYGGIPMEYDTGNASYGDIANAFYAGLFAYDGWSALNFVVEELVNPKRNLPLAIFISLACIMAFYVLMNLAYLSVLDKSSFIASNAVAIDVGNSVLGPVKFIIPLIVASTIVGSANGALFSSGRIGYAASRDGHFPTIVSYVHATLLTPSIAIIWTSLLAVLMIAYSDTVNQLIGFFCIVKWIFYSFALISVLIFRYTKRNAPRPVKVPLVIPIFALGIALTLLIAPIIDNPSFDYLLVLGFAMIGMVFYVFFVYQKKDCPYADKLTRSIQRLALVAPSPYRED